MGAIIAIAAVGVVCSIGFFYVDQWIGSNLIR